MKFLSFTMPLLSFPNTVVGIYDEGAFHFSTEFDIRHIQRKKGALLGGL